MSISNARSGDGGFQGRHLIRFCRRSSTAFACHHSDDNERDGDDQHAASYGEDGDFRCLMQICMIITGEKRRIP